MNENKPMENQASVFDFSASQYDFFRKLITPRIMEKCKKSSINKRLLGKDKRKVKINKQS